MTASTTLTMPPATGDVTIPAQRRATPDMSIVEWNRKVMPGNRLVVQVHRTGGIEHLWQQFRAGVIQGFTILQDLTVDELVTAVGMSGQTMTAARVAADPLRVARAALTTLDDEGVNAVREIARATHAVLTGRATLTEHAIHTHVWPTPVDYQRCHALITALVDTLPLREDEDGDE